MNNETCDIDTGECDYNGCALPGFESPLCSGKLFKRVCGHLVHLGIKKLMIIKVVYLCSKLAKPVVKKKTKKQTISTFCLVRRIQDKTKLFLVTQNICYFKD